MLLDAEMMVLVNSDLQVIRDTHAAANEDSEVTLVDIVNPYSYPVIYNQTFTLSLCRELRPAVPPTPPPVDEYTLSTRFACIPTLFSVSPSDKGLACHAHAYINNVDPSLISLHSHIETILAKSIPLLEHVLTDLHRDNPLPQRIKGSCVYTEWDEPEEPEHSDDEDGWANYEREMRTWTLQRPISIPDIPEAGYPGGLEERRTVVSLRGKDVKVLLKVTDIRLVCP